jgi:hypothetical protein
MNRKVISLSMTLAAALASAAMSASPSLASMTLPVFSGSVSEAKDASGAGALHVEGGATIKCTSGGEGGVAFESGSRHLGSVTVASSGCTEGGEPCFSLGASGETISTTGTWHLALMTRSSTDSHLFLFLLKQIHIECPKAAVKLFLVSGDVAGLITEKSGSKTTFEISIATKNAEGKVQEYSEFENEAGTGVKTSLEVIQEGGKAKRGFQELTCSELIFSGETSIEK